jgi:hypothetical protein
MANDPTFTIQGIRTSSPLPWRSQVNYNLQGNCRMIDAKGHEVPLMTIMAFAGIMSNEVATGKQPGQAAT